MRPLFLLSLVLTVTVLSACAPKTPAYREVRPTASRLPSALPAEPVLLTVRGRNGSHNLTLRQLEALRVVEYRAHSPQLPKAHLYRGVLLSDLEAFFELEADQGLEVTARDGYRTVIRAQDYRDFPVMLAFASDGRPMTVAQKGPLMIVFPTGSYPARFLDVEYGPQWVWYVRALRAV
ncbi:hypothetical protein HNR42_002278 [Deinobacterium chartae]|uniref:Oxidoreductase molybdopterin-binding domain-containing protein n=1 Tax=Deinobacterium chartae TaxID=521158 RepID=A0A841I0U8_9DEIO|nr:hypothetical protein [Deinobacterium chartae]MBB6098843.1 hypothetical protein [Deinobacterium chartae]